MDTATDLPMDWVLWMRMQYWEAVSDPWIQFLYWVTCIVGVLGS